MDDEIDNKKKSKKKLKKFFIKLFSISLAIILIINFLFNTILADRLEKIDKILNFADEDSRFAIRDKLRLEIENVLEKDNLINEEDKILLYKLYLKIKEEFKDLDKNKL